MKRLYSNDPRCTGCRTCELVCALARYGEQNPKKGALRIHGEFPAPGVYRVDLCTQCGVCAEECPSGAIMMDEAVDGLRIDPELCTDCGVCVDACPFGVIFTHRTLSTPIKCDLCGDCVAICPRDVLSIDVVS